MTVIFWTLLSFFSGAVPYSFLIGKFILGVDIRTIGDGNPGGTNVIRAGSVPWGIVAILADFFKAMIPVAVAYHIVGIQDWRIIPIGIAPLLGHAFTPFLNFKGGKALAATFGVWGGLTFAEVPVMLGLFMVIAYRAVTVDGWAMILAMLPLSIYFLLFRETPEFFGVWLGNWALLVYKHRADLRQPLRLKPLRP